MFGKVGGPVGRLYRWLSHRSSSSRLAPRPARRRTDAFQHQLELPVLQQTESMLYRHGRRILLVNQLPWLVLVAGLAITYGLQHHFSDNAYHQLRDHFYTESHDLVERVRKHMDAYRQVLYGLRGLFVASVRVERDQFRDYVAALDLQHNYPGIQAIGFAEMVAPEQKEQYIAALRQQGFPDFTLRPAGERPSYSSITYVEPFVDRNLRAFGYDMYSEPVRRAAMEKARDSGQPVLSGKVKLVQEDGRREQVGCLMYIPIYRNGTEHDTVEQRRQQLVGWVYEAFRMDDLMAGILASQSLNLDLEIYDGYPPMVQTLMYDSTDQLHQEQRSARPLFERAETLSVVDHHWTIQVNSLPSFEAQLDRGWVRMVQGTGLLASVLITLLLWRILKGREMAWRMAQAMTEDVRESQYRLQRELLRNKAFLANAFDGIHIVDTNLRIVEANASFAAMHGYSVEEVQDMAMSAIAYQWDDDQLRTTFEQMVDQQAIFESEHRRKDGSVFAVEISACGIAFENERLLVATCRDITERRQIMEQLQISKQHAERAAQAKSSFLASMSHEIRTPMNAIIGLTYLCLQTPLTAQQKDYLTKVHNAANALLHIINDILDFSKIEAGRLEIETIPFTLEEVLGNLAAVIAVKAQEKRIEFLMETDRRIPAVLVGDPLRIGQILLNLASNAIKFTEQGEVIVITQVLDQDDQQVHLQFTIRDSGIGMTEQQMAGLFQAFSQADASTTRRYGGTGLGLAICKRMVTLMGGTIAVESVPRSGSTFRFDLHLGVADPAPKAIKLPRSDLHGLKVLVVDDNEQARRIMEHYLTSFSFSVTTASDGQQAIAAVQQAAQANSPFDLILMDYWMPGVDGLAAAAAIKQQLSWHPLPTVILATAYGKDDAVKQALQQGFIDGLLVKPIHQSLLFNGIMEAFGHTEPVATVSSEQQHHACRLLSGAHILLVEDNDINQQVAQELLQRAGIQVTIAGDGQQALNCLAQQTFDGVLMDMQMPVMDGLTATRRIRQQARWAELPIIAMTANAMDQDREACLSVGMQAHIAKPIRVEEMFATLVQWIRPTARSGVADHQQPCPTQDEAAELPEMAGINSHLGLQHVDHRRSLYWDLLAKFNQRQSRAAAAIRTALEQQEWDTAERLSHTLKGLAATIGAEQLQQLAKQLEGAIHRADAPADCFQLLEQVAGELGRVCHSIEQALAASDGPAIPVTPDESATTPAPAPAGGVDQSQLAALFQQTATALLCCDSAAESLCASIEALVRQTPGQQKVAAIQKKLAVYDFDAALALLQAWAEQEDFVLDGME
ncbi:MAG: CHASE domain-containing protein [Magnetococcales bacterium]|nr:CHASE domain-containing protein [Magnetococcales bacterium]